MNGILILDQVLEAKVYDVQDRYRGRTFAFSAHRDTAGEPVYAPCHKFREDVAIAERVANVTSPELPILPDDSLAIWSLDPAGDALPMGPAGRRSVEAALLKRSLERG